MQRKLSLWAEQDKERKFYGLYDLLYDKDWLRLAHDYVKQNAGSVTAGCDGIDMKSFDENREGNLQKTAQELKTETFEPYPVRRVYIPKDNGKVRPLGIPTIGDRIVQEAIRMVLEPIYEGGFSQYSFGFRPNRCTRDAIKCITWSTQEHKKYFWIIEGDISSYFDTINQEKLTKLLRKRLKDEWLLKLIWKFLRAGVMEGKLFKDTKQGTPQGGIASPLLANIYLTELDRYMERYTALTIKDKTKRRKQGKANYTYIRYADDFVVLCNGTKEEAEAIKEELHNFLKDSLKLNLSKEKTKVTHINDGFKFLGFWIQRSPGHNGMKTKVDIPKEAIDRVLGKLSHATNKTSHQDSLNTKIQAMNRIIGGWCRYYQYTSKANSTFSKIEYESFWLLAHWIGRKFQVQMPEVMRRYHQGNRLGTKEYQLIKAYKEFPTLHYKKRFLKPNPYTTREVIQREEFPEETRWTGWEARPGMADLRPIVLARDEFQCQRCGEPVTPALAQVDHKRPVRRFKKPVDANRMDNLQTLCLPCHGIKTEEDRRMESPVP
jgi:group II intron reverse transcriptase/maturase